MTKSTFAAVVVCTIAFAAIAAAQSAQSSDLPGDGRATGADLMEALITAESSQKLDADLSEKLETASTSEALIKIRQKLRLRHTNKAKWPKWMIAIGNSVSKACKKLGSKFQDFFNNFKKMFGFSLKLPKIEIGSSVVTVFKNAADSIKGKFQELADIAKKHTPGTGLGDEMMLATEMMPIAPGAWVPGAWAAVKYGEKLVGPIVNFFCSLINGAMAAVKAAFNSLVAMITGFIPEWLMKIIHFMKLDALFANLLFKAFTLGWTLGFNVGRFSLALEAGYAISFNSAFLIQDSGCYLAGSSANIFSSKADVSVGLAVSAFKNYGNVGGDHVTLGIEANLCSFLGLPCTLTLGGALVFDNGGWDGSIFKNSKAYRVFQECFGSKSEYMTEIQNLEVTNNMATMMVQTMSKAELEANILQEAIQFFVNGAKKVVPCVKAIFSVWIGIGIGISASASSFMPPAPGDLVGRLPGDIARNGLLGYAFKKTIKAGGVSPTFTFDYTYSQPGMPYIVVGKETRMCDTENTAIDPADVHKACSENLDCEYVGKIEKDQYEGIEHACWYLLRESTDWHLGHEMWKSNLCQDGKIVDGKIDFGKECNHASDFSITGVIPTRARYSFKTGACRYQYTTDTGKKGEDYVEVKRSNGSCKARCDDLDDCKAFELKLDTDHCELWKVTPKFKLASAQGHRCYTKESTFNIPSLPKKRTYQKCHKDKCNGGDIKLWRKPKGCCAFGKGACDTCVKPGEGA